MAMVTCPSCNRLTTDRATKCARCLASLPVADDGMRYDLAAILRDVAASVEKRYGYIADGHTHVERRARLDDETCPECQVRHGRQLDLAQGSTAARQSKAWCDFVPPAGCARRCRCVVEPLTILSPQDDALREFLKGGHSATHYLALIKRMGLEAPSHADPSSRARVLRELRAYRANLRMLQPVLANDIRQLPRSQTEGVRAVATILKAWATAAKAAEVLVKAGQPLPSWPTGWV